MISRKIARTVLASRRPLDFSLPARTCWITSSSRAGEKISSLVSDLSRPVSDARWARSLTSLRIWMSSLAICERRVRREAELRAAPLLWEAWLVPSALRGMTLLVNYDGGTGLGNGHSLQSMGGFRRCQLARYNPPP